MVSPWFLGIAMTFQVRATVNGANPGENVHRPAYGLSEVDQAGFTTTI
jgi:hypothetical protein